LNIRLPARHRQGRTRRPIRDPAWSARPISIAHSSR
jgi:hypothetical protein